MEKLSQVIGRVLQNVADPSHVGTEQCELCLILRQSTLEGLKKLYHLL